MNPKVYSGLRVRGNTEASTDSRHPVSAAVIFKKNKRKGRRDGGEDAYASKIPLLSSSMKGLLVTGM